MSDRNDLTDAAAAIGERASRQLDTLFGKLGNSDHPNGAILSAYRQARRTIAGNINDPYAISLALNDLRAKTHRALTDAYMKAQTIGVDQGIAEVELYDLTPLYGGQGGKAALDAAVNATMQILDRQIAQVQAMLQARSVNNKNILGDKTRPGILAPGALTREANRWANTILQDGRDAVIDQSILATGEDRKRFGRMAVATLDAATTECCRRIDGAVVGLTEDFKLTGTPRYANTMFAPPFHPFCRSTVVLVPR